MPRSSTVGVRSVDYIIIGLLFDENYEMLMISAVGGKDNFVRFFSRDIQRVILNSGNEDPFSRVILITDRDEFAKIK